VLTCIRHGRKPTPHLQHGGRAGMRFRFAGPCLEGDNGVVQGAAACSRASPKSRPEGECVGGGQRCARGTVAAACARRGRGNGYRRLGLNRVWRFDF
jgi:hypothetical protein